MVLTFLNKSQSEASLQRCEVHKVDVSCHVQHGIPLGIHWSTDYPHYSLPPLYEQKSNGLLYCLRVKLC